MVLSCAVENVQINQRRQNLDFPFIPGYTLIKALCQNALMKMVLSHSVVTILCIQGRINHAFYFAAGEAGRKPSTIPASPHLPPTTFTSPTLLDCLRTTGRQDVALSITW